MFPSDPADNLTNRLALSTHAPGNLGIVQTCYRKMPDFFNLGLGKPGHSVALAPCQAFGVTPGETIISTGHKVGAIARVMICPMRHSALHRRIVHIVSIRSREEVIGPDARADITLVAHVKAGGDRAMMQFIRKPVRRIIFAGDVYPAIALPCGSSPQPAAIRLRGLLHMRPKQGDRIGRFCQCVARMAAILSPVGDLGVREHFPTLKTNAVDWHLPSQKETLAGRAVSCLEKPHKALEGHIRKTAPWHSFSKHHHSTISRSKSQSSFMQT